MSSSPSELPRDLDACHALIRRLDAELRVAVARIRELASQGLEETAARIAHLEASLAEADETIADQEQALKRLAADNALLKRSLFGQRRERFTEDPDQALLFDATTLEEAARRPDGSDDQEDKPRSRRRRSSQGRRPRVFPDFLPREERRFILNEEDIPEELRDCPDTRRFFRKVGEQLEVIPLQLKVVELYQEVIMADRGDETTAVCQARRPPTLLRSFAGDSLLAYLTVCRFADHLPYYRIEDVLGRGGFRIDRSTQWRWMRGAAEGVAPLVELMWERALQSQCLLVDETPVKELHPGGTLTGYLWTAVGDSDHPYDCFFYTSDRRSVGPETRLAPFEGFLLSDAFVGYERIGRLQPRVVKASCWAHGRRKFEECHHLGATEQTRTALAYMRRLFDIEDLYKDCGPEERAAGRQTRSGPIVEALREWLLEERARQLPKSKLKAAINYMLNRWESFVRFLESGEIPLTSNAAERSLKHPILGRKAWLFLGCREAGETAARLFTLTKTCARHRIDPFAYLQDVYARLPTLGSAELPSLLPDRWIQEHPQHVVQQRVQEALDRAQRTRERRAARRAA